jgi:hypothetical protein
MSTLLMNSIPGNATLFVVVYLRSGRNFHIAHRVMVREKRRRNASAPFRCFDHRTITPPLSSPTIIAATLVQHVLARRYGATAPAFLSSRIFFSILPVCALFL